MKVSTQARDTRTADALVLEQRASALAQTPTSDELDETAQFLAFRVGGEWYGVWLSDVREVFQECAVTPLPCVPDHVAGVANLRGEIMSVTDAACLMGLGSVSRGCRGTSPAVVVEGSGIATALLVEEIGGILDVPLEQVEAPVGALDRTPNDFISASVFAEGHAIGLIDAARLLQPFVSSPRT